MFPTTFTTYFFDKTVLLFLSCTNLPTFIARLSLTFKIVVDMCIVIVCFPGCDI